MLNEIYMLREVVAAMDKGRNYRIIWSPLATHVWLQETCGGDQWNDVKLIDTGLLGRFLNMVRYAGFYVREYTNGSGAKTYSLV